MRKLFVLFLLQISFAGFAQNKPFKVTIAGGYAAPTYKATKNDFSKAGFVYSIEPQYELDKFIKNLDLGFRFEQAFVQRTEYLDNALSFPSQAKSIMSGVLTANYVVNLSGPFRPYIGAGVGVYYVDKSTPIYSSISYPIPVTTNLGGLFRVGVKVKIFHVEGSYNLVGDTSVKNSTSGLTMTADNSYYSVKAGLTIGGSR
ncbi:outer membrane beta-barrel protein [Spirosoma sp. KCTC 42546]|uniref:outer membrane beta-barrel protein n=1 Tax=Spirosoma sp. KCTC 42546 TaxID=2520506 RepID=UPI00115C0BFB|nr:outer membrane beta-barrel protein [Spirosoma sp. KCTC 42546]QDK82247.1 outer membrane beta-barrel protein [Spirosoma sp. KCTC 42546]